jgi:general L-amino acid transport system permease protein
VVRGLLIQLLVAGAVIALLAWLGVNTATNLRRQGIASGFDFLGERAGFRISQTLIPYTPDDTFFRAFLVGLTNTLFIAALGIIFATIIGFLVGIARLSKNWLLARLGTLYVEVIRNIPLLVFLLFLYKAVLAFLPGPRAGYDLPLGANLNIRGLFVPRPIAEPGLMVTAIAFLVALVAAVLFYGWADRWRQETGRSLPVGWIAAAIVVSIPALVFVATGSPLDFSYPTLQGLNFVGGLDIYPEFLALLIGLSVYTASFIAEVVRGGILAVSRGQREAAAALGLRAGPTLRRVIIPQAVRVIIPPLTNQYLNLTKNSSLAVAVGYPDLVSVFSQTVLSLTGQAIEVVAIMMGVYLALSVLTSALMNWFNARVALVER